MRVKRLLKTVAVTCAVVATALGAGQLPSLASVSSNAAATSEQTPDTDRRGNTQPAEQKWYPTIREEAKGLAGHTVYRPADMSQFKARSVPVIVWANGACRNSNLGFMITLTTLANHGFVVVANGAFDQPITDVATPANPQLLIDAINWVENGRHSSQFRNRLDTSKIGMAGQSCGGVEALVAADDRRVDSLAAVNTGIPTGGFQGFPQLEVTGIKAPTLVVNGGPSDVAYQNSIDNYNLLSTPVYLAQNPYAGHSGLWFGIRDGAGNVQMADQGVKLLTNWFDYTLNGNQTAKNYFVGENCGLCVHPDWKVQSKKGVSD